MAFTAEILAPAGSPDAVTAAVRCGANAVYLGGKAFNARRSAANFTDEELLSAVRYCHARNVKVYITLNTLIGDGEMKSAYEAVECACNVNADALILQDIGLIREIRRIAPDMPLHASTQMSVQSIDGVRRLEQMGFCRVVLPRELSFEDIKTIAASTDIELEMFVHGALCMSVSGQCLMSAAIGGRSGNRGACAQPCRLPFGLARGDGGNFLSLKDLSLVDELQLLEKAGVASFKIEGRMKRPEYVAAAVTACRESLDGSLTADVSENLRAVFSRSGFTKGYFEDKIGPDMFGIRRKEDVTDASPVLASLRRLYDKERANIPVDFEIKCLPSQPVSLVAKAGNAQVAIKGDTVPAPAVSKPATLESLTNQLSKCGATQFVCGSVKAQLDDGLNVPVSAINVLRRDALAQLDCLLTQRPSKRFIQPVTAAVPRHTAGTPKIYARFLTPGQLEGCELGNVGRVIVPLTTDRELVGNILSRGVEVAAEIPRAYFSNGAKYKKQLEELKNAGVTLAYAGTLDGIELAQSAGLAAGAFFGSNIYNTSALLELEEGGISEALLSCELTAAQIAALGGDIPRGIIAYGRLPLMLTRSCPVRNALSCAQCKGKSSLIDRMGEKFPVICSNGCSEVLNSRVIYLADRLGEFKSVDFEVLYFTNESAEECSRVIADYRSGAKPQGEFTRGLYFRGVE